MVAKIEGFYTRAELGMRPPRSISYNISPELGGAAVHWGGPGQRNAVCRECQETWRKWQNYHMDKHGWADIAYTMGFCNHGYVFAGRGYGIRTAANGTNDGNRRFYAYVWIGGKGQMVTVQAYDALDWCIENGRSAGRAGREVRPHRAFTGSECPGSDLLAHAGRRHLSDVPTTEETTNEDEEMVLKRGDTGRGVQLIQGCYNNWAKSSGRPPITDQAGTFGASTEAAIKSYQTAAQLPDVNGVVDGITSSFLLRYERV